MARKRREFLACPVETRRVPGGAYAGAARATKSPARAVDDEIRRWLAENLLLDAAPDDLVRALAARGYSADEVALEIGRTLQDPYFRGGKALRERLGQREALRGVYRKLRRLRREAGRG
jgi:hypothetical protein